MAEAATCSSVFLAVDFHDHLADRAVVVLSQQVGQQVGVLLVPGSIFKSLNRNGIRLH